MSLHEPGQTPETAAMRRYKAGLAGVGAEFAFGNAYLAGYQERAALRGREM